MANKKPYSTKRQQPQKRSRKKSWVYVIAVLLVVTTTLIVVLQKKAQPYTPEFTGGPRLKVNKESLDLGNQKNLVPVLVSFELSNVGDQPLVFTEAPYIEVVKGCCPPTPEIGTMTLQPGQKTTLSFKLMMHEGMDGFHDFKVHIPNNDPAKKDQTLEVLSNWVP